MPVISHGLKLREHSNYILKELGFKESEIIKILKN